jgi:DNA-binding PadR family transcriptional regulator
MPQNPPQPESQKQRGQSLASLVAARYDILTNLSQHDPLPIVDLVSRTGKDEGNLSRYMIELQEYGLVGSIEEPSKLGRPKKLYRLTELGRKLLAPYLEASRPVELHEPDHEELTLLMAIIASNRDAEARTIAMKDIIHLSQTTRLWKEKNFMKFLDDGLAKQESRHDVLDLIRKVCSSALQDEDRKTAQNLSAKYEDKIAAVVRDTGSDRNLRCSAMLTYLALEEANAEKYSKLMSLTQNLLEQEPKDGEFDSLEPYIILWLRQFWKTNPSHARKWLYKLMQTKDNLPLVVKRAIQLRKALDRITSETTDLKIIPPNLSQLF